jgi:HD-GYP domain-containing protein (c-di-GMP phosphodiesterase class II)
LRLINLDNLQEGMEVGQDIYDEHNRLLLGRGATVRGPYISRLRKMGLPALYVQNDDTKDIVAVDVIAPAARSRAISNLTQTFNAVTQSVDGLRATSLKEAHEQVRSKRFMDTFKSSNKEGLEQIVGDVDTLIDQLMEKDVVAGLNSIKVHDNYTFQHSIDVSIMGILLARKIGWNKERLKAFGVGCILHDIGKIFIEKEILTKSGKLTEREFKIMKAHPVMGYQLVKTIAPSLGYLVPHVAFQHHERQDGSGYPRGISGNNKIGENAPNTIHDFGAVAAVADIYDAMTSDRPYRAGWPPDRVVHMIRDLSGTHLNTRVVDIFLRTVAPHPIGTCIRMLNGSNEGFEGVVVEVDDAKIDRPQVRLLFDASGERIEPINIDLGDEADLQVMSIRDGEPDLEPLGSSKTADKTEPEDDEA